MNKSLKQAPATFVPMTNNPQPLFVMNLITLIKIKDEEVKWLTSILQGIDIYPGKVMFRDRRMRKSACQQGILLYATPTDLDSSQK